MPNWYEVFDNEEVQYVTRQQAALLTALVSAVIALTVTLLALGTLQLVPWPVTGFFIFAAWFFAIAWIHERRQQLRRIVWCIKLSDRHLVGYDYTRQRNEVDWIKVRRVELDPNGLVVHGPAGFALHIPHLFPDFSTLSHRIVHYADLYDVPIYVDGQPWQELDVYALFPFLDAGPSPDAPGPASGSVTR